MSKRWLPIVIILSIGYPFLVYWGLQHLNTTLLIPLLLVLLSLRWIALDGRAERNVIIATVISLVVIIILFGHELGLKFYPVLMNVGFLLLFASSLFTPMSFIERIARLKEPNLPSHAVRYTRNVTIAWSIFFLINGSIAAITALWASDKVWMLYNGMIAYLLMGTLALTEWLIRLRVRQQ
jgi:uncharacterized membrane protein